MVSEIPSDNRSRISKTGPSPLKRFFNPLADLDKTHSGIEDPSEPTRLVVSSLLSRLGHRQASECGER